MFQDTNSLALIYYLSEWIVRIAMLVIVPFRRTPEAARSWLLLVLFLPWPALLLYWLIGRPTFPRWRRQRFMELPTVLQITASAIAQKTSADEPDLPAALQLPNTLGLEFQMMTTSFFLSRETLISTDRPGMARWRERLFIAMSRSSARAMDFFNIPINRVVELGTQIEL